MNFSYAVYTAVSLR